MSSSSELGRAAFGIPIATALTVIGLLAVSNWRGLAVREVYKFCDEKGYSRPRNPMILARVAGGFFLVVGVTILFAALRSVLS